ncbi:MAG TPA: hypothetical protein DCS93_24915 [Microscillaceae bacterium]|nr:hypothetical protein [Microscillaceae bacterium]
MRMKKQVLFILGFVFSLAAWAQPTPFIEGNLPIQAGKKLVFNPDMSDEFNGQTLNRNKWQTASPTGGWRGWKGRFPGLFQDSAVSVKQGKLWIKASAQNAQFQGRTWTHQGGLVRSNKAGLYGYYECKMKANRTIMSSTFWLNSSCDGTRSTELDITEVVGEGEKPWIVNNNMRSMNFNTHHWRTCRRSAENDFARKGSARLAGNAFAYEDYHVYGAFWKSKDLIIFYLDGKEVDRITPRSDFNLEMHMLMVVETYDWNAPNPGKDGMGRSADARSTTYEYVRAWKIADDNTPSTAINIPGRIEAENFTNQSGIQTENTTDAGGGQNVGYVNNGDFVEYAINATSVGRYDLDFRVASATSGGKITISSNGNVLGSVNVANTGGWQNWATVSSRINLPAGAQTLRFDFSGTANYLLNINYVDANLVATPVTTTLAPIHDTYLQGSTNINHNILRVEAGNRVSYLMFDLSKINGTITNAKLKLTCNSDPGNGNLVIALGNQSNWTESNLSGNNKPNTATNLGNLNTSYAIGTTYTWNLNASAINKGGNISLIVSQTGGNDVAFAASENTTFAPQLEITYTPSGTSSNARTTVEAASQQVERFFNKSQLYPNPSTQGVCYLNLKGHSNKVNIRVFNALGKLVYEGISQEKQVRIESQRLQKPGTYFVQIQSNRKTETLRLCIH